MPQPAFNIHDVIAVARKAGDEIMALRPQVIANPDIKGDGSPVTLADKRSSAIVIEGLTALTPDTPVVSEENDDAVNRAIVQNNTCYWIVDPLDGTQTYIDGYDGFGVHIGLIDNGVPVAGAIYFPAQGVVYYTQGDKAYRQLDGQAAERITVMQPAAVGEPVVLATAWSKTRRPQLEGIKSIPAVGGARACAAAEGSVAMGLIESPFSYWDIAAAHAVLRAAGGELFDLKTGTPTRYPNNRLYIDPAIGGHADVVAKHRPQLSAEADRLRSIAKPRFPKP